MTEDHSVRQQAMRFAHYRRRKNHRHHCRVFPIHLALLGGNGNKLNKRRHDIEIKRQKNNDRHGPRPIPNVCHIPHPPSFSIQTTFDSHENLT